MVIKSFNINRYDVREIIFLNIKKTPFKQLSNGI